MNYRLAAAVVATATIGGAAAIYFGEPFETVTCYVANGAETDCSSAIVTTPDDGQDEDLPAVVAVLVVGLGIAAALLATRFSFRKWRAQHQQRQAEVRAERRPRESPHNRQPRDVGHRVRGAVPHRRDRHRNHARQPQRPARQQRFDPLPARRLSRHRLLRLAGGEAGLLERRAPSLGDFRWAPRQ